jgi:hypothetical protein
MRNEGSVKGGGLTFRLWRAAERFSGFPYEYLRHSDTTRDVVDQILVVFVVSARDQHLSAVGMVFACDSLDDQPLRQFVRQIVREAGDQGVEADAINHAG